MAKTLVDEFAAAALAGGLGQEIETDMSDFSPKLDHWWHSPRKLAERAYDIADAMMLERQKRLS